MVKSKAPNHLGEKQDEIFFAQKRGPKRTKTKAKGANIQTSRARLYTPPDCWSPNLPCGVRFAGTGGIKSLLKTFCFWLI